MSTLPDIDTDAAGYLQYWNAIDQGNVSSIDPSEVTSYSNINSYTLYDNGLEGELNVTTGATATFRVKDDGWMVVYGPSESNDNFTQDNGSPIRGRWDIINDWRDSQSGSSITSSAYERAINGLAQEFSNWSSMTYNASDVGIYDYDYTSASGITYLYKQHSESGTTTSYTFYPGAQYTDGTTLHYAVATGAGYCNIGSNGTQSDLDGNSNFDGVTIATSHIAGYRDDSYSDEGYGSLDLLAGNHLDGSGTEHSGKVYVVPDDYAGGNTASARLDILVTWE